MGYGIWAVLSDEEMSKPDGGLSTIQVYYPP